MWSSMQRMKMRSSKIMLNHTRNSLSLASRLAAQHHPNQIFQPPPCLHRVPLG
uniref:Uncharacterized protein n=1 Tax=Zea mays TaxID=4577 RepID=C4IYD8_MAIZE|nr:unknown [Zea mays]